MQISDAAMWILTFKKKEGSLYDEYAYSYALISLCHVCWQCYSERAEAVDTERSDRIMKLMLANVAIAEENDEFATEHLGKI